MSRRAILLFPIMDLSDVNLFQTQVLGPWSHHDVLARIAFCTIRIAVIGERQATSKGMG